MSKPLTFRVVCCISFVFLVVSACTVRLSPEYSQAFLESAVQANEDTQKLLVSLSGGSSRDRYADFSDDYNEVLGELRALEVFSGARFVPPMSKKGVEWLKSKGLEEVCPNTIECVNPTPTIVESVYTYIENLQKTHERIGVEDDFVAMTQEFSELQFDLIISFESALER